MSSFELSTLEVCHKPDEAHVLEVNGLHVHYGEICALKDVNFRIGCGHCVGLLGPNGAGKSTLIKILAGLLKRMEGEATWRGKPIGQTLPEIAYLPQVDELDRTFPLTVRGLVELGRYPHLGPLRGWRDIDSRVVVEALRTLQLEELAHRRLFQLSGGQLQRAQIARALAQEAHVFLLDEPFAGLDEPAQNMMGELMQDLAKHGRLLLVCHHDLKIVPDLFDTVLMLNRHQVAFGPTQEVFTEEILSQVFPKHAVEDAHV